jgi:hypothetical protein
MFRTAVILHLASAFICANAWTHEWKNDDMVLTGDILKGTHFFHFRVSDIRLWRMTVYSMEKHRQHCQATSFMSDLHDVNFTVTVASCFFGSHLNSMGVI